jgi:hypothetical protein
MEETDLFFYTLLRSKDTSGNRFTRNFICYTVREEDVNKAEL